MSTPSTPPGMNKGPEPARVVQLTVTHPGGRRRGSGYLIAEGRVLTAAHVLAAATKVRVQLAPGTPETWGAPAESWWTDPDPDVDLGVVRVPERDHAVAPVYFGALGSRAAVITVQAVGFPWWKLKNADGSVPEPEDGQDRYRDPSHIVGTAPLLANFRSRTLEVQVPAPPDPRVDDGSPWEGMSGASVWVGRRIVGVIARHYPTESTARLTAVRLDAALGTSALRRTELLEQLHLDVDPSGLLPDVVPPSQSTLTLSGYHAQVVDIAPDQLLGREAELDELVRFCAGDERYAWWQAKPWAGKTALMSWFALHPPAEVDVVSFFITTRYLSQSDSAAYTEALIEQLAAMTGEAVEPLRAAHARSGHLLRLLNQAAETSHAFRRRLVLILDGLDEDTSDTAGLPSIASLLPRTPAPGLRVLLASRGSPGIPGDVKSAHPLRKVIPRELSASNRALDIAREAKDELSDVLRGPSLHQDVAGLITASGGGLTLSDLIGLTGAPPYQLEPLLGGVFGRTVAGRTSRTAPAGRTGERVYLFAHETLRKTAAEQFGHQLQGYRDRLHTWADHYRQQGWPPDTPTYLLRGYVRMLVAADDRSRLVALATDRARHDRMLDLTGGDALALTEIATVVDLVRRADGSDQLAVLLVLSYSADELSARNTHVPEALPAVWQRLGSPARALALAEGIRDPEKRASALCRLIPAADATDDRALLVTLVQKAAGEITDHDGDRAKALAALARALADAGEDDRATAIAIAIAAEQTTHEIYDPLDRAEALTALAGALGAAGDHDRAATIATQAEQAALDILGSGYRPRALAALARALSVAGEHDRAAAIATRAEQAARDIPDPASRARVLTNLAEGLAVAGEHDQVAAIATRAEQTAREILEPGARADVLTALAGALAAAGEYDRAEQAAREISHPDDRARALVTLVRALAAAGEHDRAAANATRAEQITHQILEPRYRAWVLANLAEGLAVAGEHDRATAIATRAEEAARASTDLGDRAESLTELVEALGAAGEHDRAAALATHAEQVIHELPDPGGRGRFLYALASGFAHLARAVGAAGEHGRAAAIASRAEQVIHELPEVLDPGERARALADLAEALAAIGQRDRGATIVTQAALATRSVPDPGERARALADLASVLAAIGQHHRAREFAGRAERAAHEISEAGPRTLALAHLARALGASGENDLAATIATRAEQAAREVLDPGERARALADLASAQAAIGQHDRARALAEQAERATHELPGPGPREWALAKLASALAAADQHDHAEQLAREFTSPARIDAFANLAGQLASASRDGGPDSDDRSQSVARQGLLEELIALDWRRSLPVLAAVDRRALVALADHVRAESGTP
ncbi:trypsin-like peptidase domain-containing protein [Actinomycetospora endophytica]|uniref:Trypsin-like peptidase domain-containing protein n=1 Tax=Actinomycetospora endophytica TaxID=2291215 RepID=A0ABS8P5S1_9PSEU|nr:trypsin-like peptidase domain-containing protein [Actinomycetospora endophytica]MCD2193605.1 trypsin-like peptidase domain-containing protein [Actinomycetospora endophytica]